MDTTKKTFRAQLVEMRDQMTKLCPEAVSNLDSLIELEDKRVQMEIKRRIAEKRDAVRLAELVGKMNQLEERRRQLLAEL